MSDRMTPEINPITLHQTDLVPGGRFVPALLIGWNGKLSENVRQPSAAVAFRESSQNSEYPRIGLEAFGGGPGPESARKIDLQIDELARCFFQSQRQLLKPQ